MTERYAYKALPVDLLYDGKDQKAIYFLLTILGLSFWFFLGLPFASHRETYAWLAGVQTESLSQQFAFGLSSTYRPLSQIATSLGFLFLDPSTFPTNIFRQALLQAFIYGMFILAWWLIYSAAPYRRLFAVVALVGGGVFFSGYVHLFHIYGLFYVPIILTLGSLLFRYRRGTFEKREVWFALIATVLAFWHPFTTALFLGFYFGFYLETFPRRSAARHVQAAGILLFATTAIVALVAVFPRAQMPAGSRLSGFLVSYQTNEVNSAASFVALLLSQMVVLSMVRSLRLRFAVCALISILSLPFFYKGVPLLLLWFGVALIKVSSQRRWSVAFLLLTAILLPFGGGIGAPSYGLFAIIVSLYVTAMAWPEAERALSFLAPRHVMAIVAAMAVLLLTLRAGVEVPVVTKVAMPLLEEREKTYQLENALAWLHTSDYCSYEIDFTENSGSPVDSIDNVITRRNRPPSALEDVRFFWNHILRCRNGARPSDKSGTAIVTFGAPPLIADASSVFVMKGRYAPDAIVWVQQTPKP
jgi:hypothetical protein